MSVDTVNAPASSLPPYEASPLPLSQRAVASSGSGDAIAAAAVGAGGLAAGVGLYQLVNRSAQASGAASSAGSGDTTAVSSPAKGKIDVEVIRRLTKAKPADDSPEAVVRPTTPDPSAHTPRARGRKRSPSPEGVRRVRFAPLPGVESHPLPPESAEPERFPYHERQVGLRCGIHALNATRHYLGMAIPSLAGDLAVIDDLRIRVAMHAAGNNVADAYERLTDKQYYAVLGDRIVPKSGTDDLRAAVDVTELANLIQVQLRLQPEHALTGGIMTGRCHGAFGNWPNAALLPDDSVKAPFLGNVRAVLVNKTWAASGQSEYSKKRVGHWVTWLASDDVMTSDVVDKQNGPSVKRRWIGIDSMHHAQEQHWFDESENLAAAQRRPPFNIDATKGEALLLILR